MSELQAWVNKVNDFGGRISDESVLEALKISNLGSTQKLKTTGPQSAFPKAITLAEVKLPSPQVLDVTFALPNVGFVGTVDPGIVLGISAVRISWGVSAGAAMSVEVDPGRGWRHTFYASFIRVEFMPNPATLVFPPPTKWILPGGQARDLELSAAISPSSGGVGSLLRRTSFMGDIALGGIGGVAVPAFARDMVFSADVQPVSTGDFATVFANGTFSELFGRVRYTPSVLNNTEFVSQTYSRPVPQNAQAIQVQAGAATQVLNPQFIFDLAV